MSYETQYGVSGAITVLCYLAAYFLKAARPQWDSYIPPICGFIGAVLGVAAMYCVPEFPADNPIEAMAAGAVSGLAATGVHQIGKQITKRAERS